MARALGLNEDLVESLALSHDLGHTPVRPPRRGRARRAARAATAGSTTTGRACASSRTLEERYPGFPGLNLTWEVREGIAKHSGPIDRRAAPEFAEYEPGLEPPLEAQLIDLVDEIAYNHHDIDDGLESGLLDRDALAAAVPLVRRAARRGAAALAPRLGPQPVRTEVALRGLINALVTDLIDTTAAQRRGVGRRFGRRRSARAGRPLVGLVARRSGEGTGCSRRICASTCTGITGSSG